MPFKRNTRSDIDDDTIVSVIEFDERNFVGIDNLGTTGVNLNPSQRTKQSVHFLDFHFRIWENVNVVGDNDIIVIRCRDTVIEINHVFVIFDANVCHIIEVDDFVIDFVKHSISFFLCLFFDTS
jgi:hypothetical protein